MRDKKETGAKIVPVSFAVDMFYTVVYNFKQLPLNEKLAISRQMPFGAGVVSAMVSLASLQRLGGRRSS